MLGRKKARAGTGKRLAFKRVPGGMTLDVVIQRLRDLQSQGYGKNIVNIDVPEGEFEGFWPVENITVPGDETTPMRMRIVSLTF